jgi:TRAP-type C4-dicarboxylate transport system permease small subunit
MKKIGSIVEKIYFGIGAAAMGLLAVLVIFTVIMRYCFSLSWKSLSEFNVTLFAFTTFWALGLNVLRGEHVSINMLYDHFKPGLKRWITVFNYAVMMVVDCVFVHYSWIYTQKMGKQISQGMEIPMSFMYGIMPVCGVICAICIIIKVIETIRAPLSEFYPKDMPVVDNK